MEDEERPSKLRKLDHGLSEVESAEGAREILSLPAVSQSIKPLDHNSSQAAHSPNAASDQEPVQKMTMSKNQMKKLLKRQQWEEGRDYRKAKRKAKIADKRARKRAARDEDRPHQAANGDADQQAKTPRYRRPVRLPITFVIDCGFDDLMMEKERISLASQLTRSYSDNHQAPFQAHLVISSWSGLLKERFDTVLHKHYQNWKGVDFLSGDFVNAANSATAVMNSARGGKLVGAFQKYAPEQIDSNQQIGTDKAEASHPMIDSILPEVSNGQLSSTEGFVSAQKAKVEEVPPSTDKQLPDSIHQGEIVYLTSDSPHTLAELKPYSTYIIGGLVDKNRHKGICYKTACDRGVQTAKLPIGEFMEMQSRFVLATNHVVEIMVRWLECRDWGEAFMKVIPKRKGGKLKTDEICRESSPAAEEEDNDPGSESNEAVDEAGDESTGSQ